MKQKRNGEKHATLLGEETVLLKLGGPSNMGRARIMNNALLAQDPFCVGRAEALRTQS